MQPVTAQDLLDLIDIIEQSWEDGESTYILGYDIEKIDALLSRVRQEAVEEYKKSAFLSSAKNIEKH